MSSFDPKIRCLKVFKSLDLAEIFQSCSDLKNWECCGAIKVYNYLYDSGLFPTQKISTGLTFP